MATEGTIFRKPGGLVHDLDFVSDFETPEEARQLLMSYYPDAIIAYSWVPIGQLSHVYTFLVPPEGYKIIGVKRHKIKEGDKRKYRGKIVRYKLVNKETNEVAGVYNLKYTLDEKNLASYLNEDTAFEQGKAKDLEPIAVDFFTSLNGKKLPQSLKQSVPFKDANGKEILVEISRAERPMDAKINGMLRVKDLYDYNRFIEYNRLPKAKIDTDNIPYAIDKRLNISNTIIS